MFKVRDKRYPNDGHEYTVYDVRCDNTGYPHFLIYNPVDRAWEWRSAKLFIPLEVTELYG